LSGESACTPPAFARIQRIGLGTDVHAFAAPEAQRPLILGGVTVPYERGLLGHSDADVLAHAVADALLGALRAGDIGEHFPDTDPAYQGADSLELLAQVGEMVRAGGWRVIDIDSVIVAQAPRLAPYRAEMRGNLARALGLEVDQVGVKATTSEHLGFEGRGEGISAQAVALLGRFESPESLETLGALEAPLPEAPLPEAPLPEPPLPEAPASAVTPVPLPRASSPQEQLGEGCVC
jgi:2-C-methyl-D-erythritol 2,4-cyclodiphosphate synthase